MCSITSSAPVNNNLNYTVVSNGPSETSVFLPEALVNLIIDYSIVGPNFTRYPSEDIFPSLLQGMRPPVLVPQVVRKNLLHIFKATEIRELDRDLIVNFNFEKINQMIDACKGVVDFFKCGATTYRTNLVFLSQICLKVELGSTWTISWDHGRHRLIDVLQGPRTEWIQGYPSTGELRQNIEAQANLCKATFFGELSEAEKNIEHIFDYQVVKNEKGLSTLKIVMTPVAKNKESRGINNYMVFRPDSDWDESLSLPSSSNRRISSSTSTQGAVLEVAQATQQDLPLASVYPMPVLDSRQLRRNLLTTTVTPSTTIGLPLTAQTGFLLSHELLLKSHRLIQR